MTKLLFILLSVVLFSCDDFYCQLSGGCPCGEYNMGCGCGEPGPVENYDCDGNCIAEDCTGECGGTALIDEFGVCCDSSEIDACNECNGHGISCTEQVSLLYGTWFCSNCPTYDDYFSFYENGIFALSYDQSMPPLDGEWIIDSYTITYSYEWLDQLSSHIYNYNFNDTGSILYFYDTITNELEMTLTRD